MFSNLSDAMKEVQETFHSLPSLNVYILKIEDEYIPIYTLRKDLIGVGRSATDVYGDVEVVAVFATVR